jgi:cell division protein FtsW
MVALKAWGQKNLQGDPVIWAIIFTFSLLSIAVVYSAIGSLAYRKMAGDTEHYLIKHSMLVFLSLGIMWLAHKLDYRYYSKLSKVALWISVPLLVYTFFKGVNIDSASRWIMIPFIGQTFQPSDFAKLALITSLASMLARRQNNIEDFKESFIPIVLWCGVICGLIALANFSTAIILFSTCMLLMFIGRVPMKFLAMLVVVGLLAGSMAVIFGQRWETLKGRIERFMDPEVIPLQAEQSYIAIATGGVLGKGAGKSDQRNFLPHCYSDFIYAIIIEEYGLIGGGFVLFLYLALLYRGVVTTARSERAFGGLLSAGLTFSLVMQAMINMGVAVGLGPITGQPLPLLSMGGTSLLFTGLALGIIISVSRGDVSESLNSIGAKNGERENKKK